jgi:hypothetical protein
MAFILGVLGARNELTKQILQQEVLDPILEDLPKKPTQILVPDEPLSSSFIEAWGERKGIPVVSMKSDWMRHGKKASVLRDARIEKESCAYLIFEGPRSRYYVNLAEKLAKRYEEKPVYIVHKDTVSPILLEVERVRPMMIEDSVEAEILKKPNTLLSLWGVKPATKSTPCLIQDD